jgi:hypothetical protein
LILILCSILVVFSLILSSIFVVFSLIHSSILVVFCLILSPIFVVLVWLLVFGLSLSSILFIPLWFFSLVIFFFRFGTIFRSVPIFIHGETRVTFLFYLFNNWNTCVANLWWCNQWNEFAFIHFSFRTNLGQPNYEQKWFENFAWEHKYLL